MDVAERAPSADVVSHIACIATVRLIVNRPGASGASRRGTETAAMVRPAVDRGIRRPGVTNR